MKKIFTAIIILLPILSQYSSPIPKLDLGTFLIFSITPFILIKIKKIKLSKENIKIKKVLFVLCAYIVISTIIACLLQTQINYFNIIVRTIKFVFLIIIIICISYDYLFDFDLGIKILKYTTLLCCLYIILQTISFYIFHRSLPGILESFIQQGEYSNLTYEYAANLAIYRPTSFFLEPSMFSEYVILYLAYVIFNENVKIMQKYLQAIIISIGIICSTSGSGYLYCALIWGIFFYNRYIRKITIRNFSTIIMSTIVAIIIIPKILTIPIIDKAIQRGVDGSETGGNAFIGRIQSFNYLENLNVINRIIGMGYGNPIVGKFMNSMSYIMYCCGILGTIIVCYLFIVLFKFKSKNESKNVFTFIWIISLFFTTSFVATKICFYLSILLVEKNSDEIKKL